MDDPQSAAVASSSTAAASKLDSMSKDELTKLVKKYTVLQKRNKNKIEQLTSKINKFWASALDINCKRNSKDMSKDSIVTARKSFGINEGNILNASSIENSKNKV